MTGGRRRGWDRQRRAVFICGIVKTEKKYIEGLLSKARGIRGQEGWPMAGHLSQGCMGGKGQLGWRRDQCDSNGKVTLDRNQMSKVGEGAFR